MRHHRRGLVVVIATLAREAMIGTGIDIDLDIAPPLEASADRLHHLGRRELVERAHVEHHRALRRGGLVKPLLDADTVIGDRAVDARAGGR